MINKLTIHNFLTIENAEINLTNINVIVGESGAGKSIILKAIDSLFSSKTDTSVIGRSSDKASVRAMWKLNEAQLQNLQKFGFNHEEILIEKQFLKGRTKSYINHEPVSARTLSEIKDTLISVISQNYGFEAFSSEKIEGILDKFISKETKENFQRAFQELIKLEKELRNIETAIHQIQEKHPEVLLEAIEKVNPEKGEYGKLLDKLSSIKKLSSVREHLKSLLNVFYEGECTLQELIRISTADLGKTTEVYPELSPLLSSLNESSSAISEYRDRIYTLAEKTFEEGETDKIESRLFELESLQRKFSKPVDEIVEDRAKLKENIAELESLRAEREWLERELSQIEEKAKKHAQQLSNERKAVSERIKNMLKEYLKIMAIPHGKIEFAFKQGRLKASGTDNITLLFSANPDFNPADINKVASGGERARFILALMAVMTKHNGLSPTIIFDEIDSGVSGKALKGMISVIENIARSSQVILITHNRNIMPVADTIIEVIKVFEDNRTKSIVSSRRKE